MKNTANLIKKTTLLAVCVFLSSFLSAMADERQEQLNLDYFRTPEAAVFKKYAEESVNEYTGTADISVPLYTVKCKDIEIPIVLRYDASGIKVEQEASWVGLGWNLMVGGCINYVCAGGHDMYGAPDIPNKVWTEYLTSQFTPWTAGNALEGGVLVGNSGQPVTRNRDMYYVYDSQEASNWMARLPYQPQCFIQSYADNFSDGWGMREYMDWGYGERDFYSVNVLGKSFMFFIDPFTLKVFNIGKAGEDFTVEPEYDSYSTTGIGNQADVCRWKITDSDGYVYKFEVADRFQYDPRNGAFYTSCWYLKKIVSPLGEEVEFNYCPHTKNGRRIRTESYRVPFSHEGGARCCGSASRQDYVDFLQNENSNMNLTSHYLSEIKTGNQTVSFGTSPNNECSGRRLNTITVKSYDGTLIKTVSLSYSSFSHCDVGGDYDPSTAEYGRLKLDSVSETASTETLTTSFSYNPLELPSKRSCAQDYWGYYNGKDNYVEGRGHTLIPAPTDFMTSNYSQRLSSVTEGADRFSDGYFMQAAMLNKVVYPTGGYTEYEYEPNTVSTNDFTLTEKYRKRQYDVSVLARFACSTSPYGMVVDQSEQIKDFTLSQEATLDLSLQCSGGSQLYGQDMRIEIYKLNGQAFGSLLTIPATFLSQADETFVQSLTLQAGRYNMVVIPINNSQGLPFSIRWNLNGWYKETTSNNNYTLPCGGLRIKKVSHYDHDGKNINYTTYDYHGGVLLNRIETIDHTESYNLAPEHYDGVVANQTHSIDVYTITPGHPRMPTFFASCNPGIVGYSKVTKSRYGADGTLEKSVVTSYRNNCPQNMYGVDYYTCFDNGLTDVQEIRDASDAIVTKTENTYDHSLVDHYATNIVTKSKCINRPNYSAPSAVQKEFVEIHDASGTVTSRTDINDNNDPCGVVDVLRYPYILSRVELSRTKTTEYCPDGRTIIKTKDYSYNQTNHQVSRIDEKNNSQPGLIRRTKITYSADGTDNISVSMKNAHRLNDVVENKNYMVVNGQEKCISTQHTAYMNVYPHYYVPASYSTSVGSTALETRSRYTYDDSLNVCSIAVDGQETAYLWSYKGQYPIARIEGLAYSQVQAAVGVSTISALLGKAKPTAADLSSIRSAVKNAGGHITTYTYKPLVGITSQTLPNGMMTRYEYDGFGRLLRAVDHNGSVISTNSYNYRKE